MIDNHGDAVLSDLSEYHRLDLVATLRDALVSPRMLLARLACLPDESSLHAAIRSEPRGWGTSRHLLATVIDAVQNNTWVTAATASKRKPRKPKPVARPKSKKQKPKQTVVSVAQMNRGGDDGRTGR